MILDNFVVSFDSIFSQNMESVFYVKKSRPQFLKEKTVLHATKKRVRSLDQS